MVFNNIFFIFCPFIIAIFLISFSSVSRDHIATTPRPSLYVTILLFFGGAVNYTYFLSLSHKMMYLQSVIFSFSARYDPEPPGLCIPTDGKTHFLRQQMSHFCRREPVRLWRLPVDEIEIRILLVYRPCRTLCSFLLQPEKNETALLLSHFSP